MLERLLILLTFSISLFSIIVFMSYAKPTSTLALVMFRPNAPEGLEVRASNSTAANGSPSHCNASLDKISNATNSVSIPSVNHESSSVAIPSPQGELPAKNTITSTYSAPALARPNMVLTTSDSARENDPRYASQCPYLDENNLFQQLPPRADAGPAQAAIAGSTVVLNGSNSRAESGKIISYSWEQMPTDAKTTLSGARTPVWQFVAPPVVADTILRFQLTVTDTAGQTGHDTVNILDKPNSRNDSNKKIIEPTLLPSKDSSITVGSGANAVLIPSNTTHKHSSSSHIITSTLSPPLTPPIGSNGDR